MRTTSNNEFTRLTVSLHPEERDVLRFIALKQKTSVARVVRELIREFLEDEEDVRESLKALQGQANTLDWKTFKKQYQ